jgi:hypothetical protein
LLLHRKTSSALIQNEFTSSHNDVVYFLLGNSPASEFYMPTFQNTLSVQTTGNYPEENVRHTERSESLKSRIVIMMLSCGIYGGHSGTGTGFFSE